MKTNGDTNKMNYFNPVKTKYEDVYIKPMNIKQSLSLVEIEDKNDRFFMPAIYCLCDKEGKLMFQTLDEFYEYFPSWELNNIVELIIKTNNPNPKEEIKSKEKNVG